MEEKKEKQNREHKRGEKMTEAIAKFSQDAFARKDTSNKFDENGNPLLYCGNTIVSFLNQPGEEMFEAAKSIQEAMKPCSFASCLAFLPPSSFHMTVLTLCREIDRSTPVWPTGISRTASMNEIDLELKKRIEPIAFPRDIMMAFEVCELNRLVVKPADAESQKKIWNYRDTVADVTGIRHSWHDTFRFHISLNYCFRPLSPAQEAESKAFCEHMTALWKAKLHPFLVPKAEFVIFNNMLAYDTDLCKRI